MRDSDRPFWRRALWAALVWAALVWAALFPGSLASRRPLTGQQPKGEPAVPTDAGSTGDRSQHGSFRPAVRPELPAVPVTSCTYATRAPLSERERNEKEALDRELDKQQSKSYFAEVNRLAKEYWAANKAGNDQSVVLIKAKQAQIRRPINELDRKLQPYRTTGYKSHGWVWFYRQVPKRDVDLAQEVLSVEPPTQTGEVALRTLASHTSVAPGQEFQVAVSFQIEDGWTIYGSQLSTDYVPATIEWDLPPGISVKGVQWPQPLSVQQGDVLQPTYQRTVTAMATIAVFGDARRDSNLPLRADVRWQVCKELVCKLGRANLETTVSVGSSVPRATTGANAD